MKNFQIANKRKKRSNKNLYKEKNLFRSCKVRTTKQQKKIKKKPINAKAGDLC